MVVMAVMVATVVTDGADTDGAGTAIMGMDGEAAGADGVAVGGGLASTSGPVTAMDTIRTTGITAIHTGDITVTTITIESRA
jgi:hypothetical protein